MMCWKSRSQKRLNLALALLLLSGGVAVADDFAPGYDLIRDDGTDENRRGALNLTGAGVSCTDDSANNETECDIAGGAGSNSFETITVPAGTAPVADSSTDTLTITETTFLTLTGTAATDTIAITQVTTDLGTDGLIAADAVALGADTTNNYVATIADSGNTTVTVANSGTETAAVTLNVIDVNCTGCLSATELGTDSVSADELNATGVETELEAALDIAGDVSSTGMSTTVIGNDKVLEAHLKAVDAPNDEECLEYESTTGDFEWEACGGGSGATDLNLPIYSAKLTGAYVVFTPPTADACTQGAQIDAGDGNWRLLFDATTDECATWQFIMPSNYASTPTLVVDYSMASGNANEVEFEAAIMCQTPDDAADIGAASFSNVAVASETVPGTAGYMGSVTISLTDDSCAAGDIVFVVLSTDSNDATADDATGDREVVGVSLDYS